jgi:hypothetical protein
MEKWRKGLKTGALIGFINALAMLITVSVLNPLLLNEVTGSNSLLLNLFFFTFFFGIPVVVGAILGAIIGYGIEKYKQSEDDRENSDSNT